MASCEARATIVFSPGHPVTDPQAQRQKFTEFFAVSPKFTYSGHEVFLAGGTGTR